MQSTTPIKLYSVLPKPHVIFYHTKFENACNVDECKKKKKKSHIMKCCGAAR